MECPDGRIPARDVANGDRVLSCPAAIRPGNTDCGIEGMNTNMEDRHYARRTETLGKRMNQVIVDNAEAMIAKKGWCALAGVAVLLLGCSQGKDKSTIEIEYNCPANATEIASLEQEIPSFTAATHVRVRLNPFSGQEKLYAMIAAGQAPDIFYTNNIMRDRLAAEGHLLDLRSVSSEDSLVERLWPHVVENGRSVDGGWYSVGNWEYTLGVYYNKEIFDLAGVDYPDSTWTWNDMTRIASALTVDRDQNGIPEQFGIFIGSHFIEAFELMNNAPIEKNALAFSLFRESEEVYRQYLRLMDQKVMPDLLRVQSMGMQAPQMLQTGRVAMLVEAVPHQSLYETLTIRWGVVPLPQFLGVPPRYFRSGSGGLSISARTQSPEAAWKVLKWIITNASTYQPNPVLRDVDFVSGWERRYPQLHRTGFRQVWRSSLERNGGDPRYFVRFSSWTAGTILERLQPKIDQLWNRQITVEQLSAAVPEINANVRRELTDAQEHPGLSPAFRQYIQHEKERLDATVPF
jgi:multiple sugar transport system substrate-binding protein